ncbi:MAG: aminotransferase class I/II-fold pyridoxal phosphate-dependent enzyme [Lachnospiraceae bacterium]|nr:aminotransferase class I/II-fold pyridoxal phosphate-dependent enzyme [Lachnospiraceae bacterium]
MYCFNNDYSEGAHPNILNAMIQASLDQNAGYSLDVHTEHAKELIKKEIRRDDVDIHIIVGGTQTNMLTISAALRPHQAVIAAETGHINVHETGAIEATGHKVLTQQTPDGKLTPALIQKTLDWHTDEHMVQPKMVYISNTTEIGTQYTLAELEAISAFCKQHALYLFLDGARLGAALTSPINDLTLADIARLTDVFYIGGTKNGALFGECLVITHPDLKPDFRFMLKQKGAMLAKGFLLGIQFEEMFQNNLFYDMAAHSNEMAAILKKTFAECGFPFFSDSASNQQFPILPNDLIAALRENYQFQTQQAVDETHTAVRFVTSWATKEEAVRQFAADFKRLAGK